MRHTVKLLKVIANTVIRDSSNSVHYNAEQNLSLMQRSWYLQIKSQCGDRHIHLVWFKKIYGHVYTRITLSFYLYN